MRKKSIISKFFERFEYNSGYRKEILEDIQALDEIKEIAIIGSALSVFMKKNKLTNLRGKKADADKYLESISSNYFKNCKESYSNMGEETRDLVKQYAVADYNYKSELKDIKNLAISGGGGKGQFYVGALKALEDKGVLNNIETYAGTSAGALTAIPLALGMNTDELLEVVKDTDFRAFMIESRNYNTTQKRTKEKLKGISAINGKSTPNEIEKVSGIINSIKVGIESCMTEDLSKANCMENICDSHGRLKIFFNVPLEKKLETEFSEQNYKALLDEIWESQNIKKFCKQLQEKSNAAAETIVFKEPKDILMIGLSFALKQDYVEYFFSRKVHERLRAFTNDYGENKLAEIIPRMKDNANWSDLSLSELGDLARSKEGHEFGFRDLVIGVTRTTNMGEEGQIKTLWNQIRNTQGLLVSSDIAKTDDAGLSHAPIAVLARMSMSIPFEFNQKKYGSSYYIDGGLHNNLPTEYFDRQSKNGFNKETLSIIPLTGSEISSNNSIQEALKGSESFSPDKHGSLAGWLHPTSIKNILSEIKKKSLDYIVSKVTYKENTSYHKMGIRESFRNVLINTQQYSTLSFKAIEEDLGRLNDLSYETVNEIKDVISFSNSPGVLDTNYNSLIRLFEHKLIQHKSKDYDSFNSAMTIYERIKKEDLHIEPFSSKKASNAINKFINKTKESAFDKDKEKVQIMSIL